MNLFDLRDRVIGGYVVDKDEALFLAGAETEMLCAAANSIREHFCGRKFDMCSIVNGKSGRCPEDCKFCAQSAHYETNPEIYPLLDSDTIVEAANNNHCKGVLRFSVVTSGDSLSDGEADVLCEIYAKIKKQCGIQLCSSNGLLSDEQFVRLRESGVSRYHCNLETSRGYFPKICSTHTYDDKISAILRAQTAGLEVCSGGIIGMGETMEDRIDMAFEVRGLGVKSVPLNILNPISGTPFEGFQILSNDEVRRTAAVYRFIIPNAALRLAGGRNLLADKGRSVFLSGANAAISGDMLTTSGISAEDDLKMIRELGFEVETI